MKRSILAIMAIVCLFSVSSAQQNATIKEFLKTFTTYPFSDPSPVPDASSKIYPYFRYDGFTSTPQQKEWKVVELENDFIKVTILPEVGGKIWNATEKKTGKDFLYNNHVVKFRDVAMRGPWTSGGIEANYGIIGHTPNCATPVDYVTIKKEDGSASCIIGVLDLLTQTQWRLEINLPKDKAFFTTQSTWFNNGPLEQSYYTWMNTGIKAKGNLEFVYPGTHYLGHEGEYSDWPINKSNGKNISFYEQNNFGGYKSYHVFGTYTDFFGGYWHDEDYGMARYSTHDDKAGKKIWIWGLSQQGMIWEKLLSDNDGQYVEVQSGRLFNQSAEGSMYTPFKYRGFAPHETDRWTEYWFPVVKTKGFVKANEYGALNVRQENGWLKINFCPVQKMDETILVHTATVDHKKHISLLPLQTYTDSIRLNNNEAAWNVAIGDKINYSNKKYNDASLSRSLQSPANFDWTSLYGLWLAGKSFMEQRMYAQAEEKIKACLQKDGNYLPALTALSELEYRKMNYQAAFNTSSKAISINTYDPAANYYYALAALKLNKPFDAKDGFGIAAQSAEYRVPAFTQLSHIYFKDKDYNKATDYAKKSLAFNQFNIDALQLLAVAYRKINNTKACDETVNSIIQADPLNHFAYFEKYFVNPSDENKKLFLSGLRSEMPVETCMELAIWYYRLGCLDEMKSLLSISPSGREIAIWKKYFSIQQNSSETTNSLSAFPFREETATLLEQQIQSDNNWQLKYSLALIYQSKNNIGKSKELFITCGNEPTDPAFYAARSGLITAGAEADLQKAISLDKEQWRYRQLLTEYYLAHEQNQKAWELAENFYQSHTGNYVMGMLYAKTLLVNGQYKKCDALLSTLTIIPFEGATEGRVMYRESKLQQALSLMKAGQYKKTLPFIKAAQLWPENLGSGKPYDEDIDTRLEDWMSHLCLLKINKKTEANEFLQRIIAFNPRIDNTVSNFFGANHLVTAWALEKTKGKNDALKWLDKEDKRYPGNAILQWCKAAFENKKPSTPENIKDANANILQALTELK
jgi:tetratricopeptide (TPR) repeat protein